MLILSTDSKNKQVKEGKVNPVDMEALPRTTTSRPRNTKRISSAAAKPKIGEVDSQYLYCELTPLY